MKKKRIERELKKLVVHEGNFSALSKRIDQNLLTNVSNKTQSNFKFALLGVGAFVLASSLTIGTYFVFQNVTNKSNISETSNPGGNISIKEILPSIKYKDNDFYYNNNVIQPINPSLIKEKISEIDVMPQSAKEQYHVEIYEIVDKNVDVEIAIRVDVDPKSYYSYIVNI